jgi:hypothetical protein
MNTYTCLSEHAREDSMLDDFDGEKKEASVMVYTHLNNCVPNVDGGSFSGKGIPGGLNGSIGEMLRVYYTLEIRMLESS